MKPIQFLCLPILFVLMGCSSDSVPVEPEPEDLQIYFPPKISDVWETTTVEKLGWHQDKLQPLLDYLQEKHTKSFIVLYNGQIVIESYMNGHNASLPWYWASAGKTLTSTITGIAQDEGLMDIDDKVSDYLGTGWTSEPLDKENLINCKNLLSMDSGLDVTKGDDVSPENLIYMADAGDRWAYHNVYVKLQDVVAKASNQNWNDYYNTKLRDRIGMTGSWVPMDDLNVYWSTARSMARFGLLIYAKGKWENTQIVSEDYLMEATNTSQEMNKAYGYLWWLNGKSSYHLPQVQIQFSGELIPNAPTDMFAALGKNDQKIYVVPSRSLVVIRMGDSAEDTNFALSDFDNELWARINAVIDK